MKKAQKTKETVADLMAEAVAAKTTNEEIKAVEKVQEEFQKLIQQTLVILKPDAVQRGLVGEITTRFERVGLKIAGVKMTTASKDKLHAHYEDIGKVLTRHGEDTFLATLAFMQSGPVMAFVYEGVEAVAVARKLIGSTEPKSADMGTIRGDFSHVSYGYADGKHIGIANLIHGSATPEEAEQEIDLWFEPEELFDYQAAHEKYTR